MTFRDYGTPSASRDVNVGQAFQPDVRLESLTYVRDIFTVWQEPAGCVPKLCNMI